MRYEEIIADFIDRDYLEFNEDCSGSIVLCATDELIDITNEIRFTKGNADLVGGEFSNEVYYTFYIVFNPHKKEISIQAECNHGEKDDFVWYELPMTEEEKKNLMFKLIDILVTELVWQ